MIESMFGEGAFTPPSIPGEAAPGEDNIVLNIDGLEISINPRTRVSCFTNFLKIFTNFLIVHCVIAMSLLISSRYLQHSLTCNNKLL